MLHLHRSERSDALVAPLASVLAHACSDPFAPDVVAVPTRGVERWLAQRLADHLGTGPDGEGGIAANISFDSPTRLVAGALASAAAPEDDHDEWDRDRLTWHVLDVIDRCGGEDWCSALGRHLGIRTDDDVRGGRRLQVSGHLARLFASYGAQRPDMLLAWATGLDEDGTGVPLPDDLRWQAELWRRIRTRTGAASPAERLDIAVRRLREDPDTVDLPERVSVFGPTRLPEDQLRVLDALAAHRDVHLWLPHPSPALWRKVDALAGSTLRRSRSATPAAHPLLASMARDATELQLRLTALGAASTHHPAPEPPDTLLGALQRRLRDDVPTAPPHALIQPDRSVQVHACHGLARQVEVLRETLIGLFADDPTLEPRDVVVMSPDIESVAPLVAATFGLAPGDDETDAHPGRSLRVRLADRSLRQTNPLLSLVSRVLDLADGRVTASDVVDLAGVEPVRRRFGFADDDVDRIRAWAAEAGARWGEDLERRSRFGLGHVAQGTWGTALDRILLGAAMAEEDYRYVGSALPLDDVASTDVDLAGRLAELVDRLTAVLDDLDGTRPATAWMDALDRALDLLTDVAPADTWQDVEARQVLDEARRSAADHAHAPLRLADVQALLAGRLRGRPTRAGFRTGALTMCSLEPMRAVPHRVVCLLGMDDGAFPRGTGSDGDDVLLRDPLIGERDRRGEDRQLFLDAVTAAQEHLVVLYSGADERTGASRPPAVPVGELLDALDAAGATGTDAPVRERVVIHHPLQPVDERNFTDAALGRSGPFSFDAVALSAARAGRGARTGTRPFLDQPLAPVDDTHVDLVDLISNLEHPVRAFLRGRLGVRLPGDAQELEDRVPLDLDGLEKWHIGDRLLTAALAGVDLERAVQVEGRRGEVPPRHLGGVLLTDLRQRVAPIAETARRHTAAGARAVDVTVRLAGGRTVTGTVPGVHDDVLLRAVYSRLAAKHRLRAWVQLLALTAADGRRRQAVTVGRAPGKDAKAALSVLDAPSPAQAVAHLEELLSLRDAALREPLPVPLVTSCAYGRSRASGNQEAQALEDARREWKSGFDKVDDQLTLVWGEEVTLDAILGVPQPHEAEWWPEDSTRFGVLARRVWEPLLAHERTETI